MERTNGTKKGLRIAAVSFFLFAALLSTGCDALMNPVADNTAKGGVVVANPGGQTGHPGGQTGHP